VFIFVVPVLQFDEPSAPLFLGSDSLHEAKFQIPGGNLGDMQAAMPAEVHFVPLVVLLLAGLGMHIESAAKPTLCPRQFRGEVKVILAKDTVPAEFVHLPKFVGTHLI